MSHTILMVYINTSSFVMKLIGNQNKRMARYWKTTCGKNRNLNGFRRLSKCHGSLQCTNDKCLKVQCNSGLNKSSFERFAGEYTCKICGHLVQRKWCGAKKAIEYDQMLNRLTVWHQCYHNYKLKQAHDHREQKEEKKECSEIYTC